MSVSGLTQIASKAVPPLNTSTPSGRSTRARLRHPEVRIREAIRTVVGHHEVESSRLERQRLPRSHGRARSPNPEARTFRAHARAPLEASSPTTAHLTDKHEPELRRATAELEHVDTRDLTEHASSRSGSCHRPQRSSSCVMNSSFSAWYSSEYESQNARFRRACSVRSSDELIGREPEADLALG